ncbi:ATP-binding protein [Aquabacterium sp. CECT 9606]|uniref:sensor histidine kinase n=1 Tax=Aquabacterium sp. CECT 9606 TaxID=2845822 RepID=UPI001E5353C7|nr:ATP-binding protein [Aquabacterium sp. CECT 9606]CAH0349448.1 Adaptive-response sensory-kinase SasA [Aquabacterium sp. CECT 9606]
MGWGAVGLLTLVAMVLLGAPVWAHSLFLLLWCVVWATALVWLPAPVAEIPPLEPLAPAVEAVNEADQAALPPCADRVPAMSESDQEVLRYALSHDLRAPLRVVDGFTRILKEDYGKVLDRVGNDHLDRVLAASSRMNGMIDAILAQAQLAREPVARERIDLSVLAKEVVKDLSDLDRDEGLVTGQASRRADFKVAEGMVAEADPTLVRRVLDNLMGNALKYSAKVEHPCIEVGVMPATNPAVFYVKDNGAGFDMQHADKLFGLFQRLHSAKEFPGTGVGLAGVKNIISRHEGRVWAEAQSGQGACFYFTLISAAQAQAQGRQG